MGWVRCGLGTPSNILALPTPSEASGAIAQFNTDLTENLLHAIAEFNASQAAGTPTPSVPIPIVGVDKVYVSRTGKNLFDKSTITWNKGLAWATGDYFSETGSYVSDFIPVKAGMTLSFSNVPISQCFGYDKDKNYILVYKNDNDGWMTPQSGGTFRNPVTIPSDICFIRISRRVSQIGSSTIDEDISTMQIELGEQSTAYEAYNGTTALINLGGTYYGGSVDAVTGKITLTHRIKSYDKNSAWTMNTSGVFYASAPSGIDDLEMCNYFEVFLPRGSSNAIDDGQCRLNSNRTNINFKILSCETLEDFKTWLGDNTIQVVYSLATPIVVYASNTAEIPTINGFNQVFADTDTGDIAVKYFETVGHKI